METNKRYYIKCTKSQLSSWANQKHEMLLRPGEVEDPLLGYMLR